MQMTASTLMKSFIAKALHGGGKLARLFLSRSEMTRRALLRTERRERAASEAERLDRLRNPGDYRGK